MEKSAKTMFGEMKRWINKYHTPFYLSACIIMILLVYVLVYNTGGIKYVYSHTMYIPILICGLALGRYWALLIAVIAGVLLGPFMPIEVTTGESQAFINWFYRLLIFVLIGGLSGFASEINKANKATITGLLYHHMDTELPNINSVKSFNETHVVSGECVFLSIIIANEDSIVTTVGMNGYYEVLQTLYMKIKDYLPDDAFIAQIDSVKFWAMTGNKEKRFSGQELDDLFDDKYIVGSRPLYVDANIGFLRKTLKNAELEASMFYECDIAAYYARKHHLTYVDYQDTVEHESKDMQLLAGFTEAMDNGEFYLVYQPVFDLESMQPILFEALIRWEHHKRGLIMPDKFISMIEETQLIHRLTDFVIKRTLAKLTEFRVGGMSVKMSVNISVRNLYDPNFCDKILHMFSENKIDPSKVELEITENLMMEDSQKGKKVLTALSDEGFSISIDDFGKGYSSLAYLSRYRLNTIKIDKEFVLNMAYDKTDQNIVKAAIVLAHELNCKVVAEGVENEKTLKMLKTMNCDYAQGFYYAKPIHEDEVITWYQNNMGK